MMSSMIKSNQIKVLGYNKSGLMYPYEHYKRRNIFQKIWQKLTSVRADILNKPSRQKKDLTDYIPMWLWCADTSLYYTCKTLENGNMEILSSPDLITWTLVALKNLSEEEVGS